MWDVIIIVTDHCLSIYFFYITFKLIKIPIATYCAPLIADLLLFCYKRDFMLSFSGDTQADVIEVFNSESRYLDELLNIESPYFEGMVN